MRLTDLFVLVAAVVFAFRAENKTVRLVCRIFLGVAAVYLLAALAPFIASAVWPIFSR